MTKFWAFLSLLLLSFGYADEISSKTFDGPKKLYVRILLRPESGFFSTFLNVLGVLFLYDEGCYAGVKVDFGSDKYFGSFFDPKRGANWWNYYFYPIEIGSKENARVTSCENYLHGYQFANELELSKSRREVHRIIQKYIRIMEPIERKVDDFVAKEFNHSFVIGVHYRGTDKGSEAPKVSYEEMKAYVDEALSKCDAEAKIFVASDEEAFVSYMQKCFPDRLIYFSAIRSSDELPIHRNMNLDGYQKGEEALIDCLLLSHCQILIRTSSNLSLCAGYFNPSLPIVEVNSRYDWYGTREKCTY